MTDSMSRTSRVRLLLVLLMSLVSLDQATKQYAVTHWKGQPGQSYVNDVLRIEYAENTGAFLSLFGKLPAVTRYAILVIGNGVLLVALVIVILTMPLIDRWSYIAWVLVFVGGIGNLIDRIRINAVIDFLNLGFGPIRTGIFNVADMAITAGFVMLVPQIFRSAPAETVTRESKAATPTAVSPGTPQ